MRDPLIAADDSTGQAPRPKLALLALDALSVTHALRRFVMRWHNEIALVALSDPFPQNRGRGLARTLGILGRSGPALLPYLAANFVLPRLAGAMPPFLRRRIEAGAGPCSGLPPVRQLAPQLGIPTETVADVNSPAFHARLRTLGVQAVLSFHFDQILTAATIAVPRLGCLNVHAGLLPEQRGPTPTVHALLAPAPQFGITLHRIVPRIDAGPILARAKVVLPAGTSALAAAEALHLSAVPILDTILPDVLAGSAAEYPMPPGPYRGMPTRSELRAIRRLGHHPANWQDLVRAMRTPV